MGNYGCHSAARILSGALVYQRYLKKEVIGQTGSGEHGDSEYQVNLSWNEIQFYIL